MKQTILTLMCLLMIAVSAMAVQEWSVKNYPDFIEGAVEHVSVTSQGEIQLAPQIETIFDTEEPYIWCADTDPNGHIYLGTGTTGKLFKVSPDGAGEVYFDAEELQITSLAVDSRGIVYVGTSPEGQIYRLERKNQATVYFDPPEKYIWSMVIDQNGTLYAGTGNPGVIYKITAENQALPLYQSETLNFTTCALDTDDQLIVGTDGEGYVMRVSPTGDIFVLFDTGLQQVHALAVAPDGTIFAGAIDDRMQFFTPPVPPPSPSTDSDKNQNENQDSAAATDSRSANQPSVVIPSMESFSIGGVNHEVYKILPSGIVHRLRTSKKNFTMCLALDSDNRLIIGTGDEGKLFALDDRDRVTLLARVNSTQITSLIRDAKGTLYAGSSNLGKLYRMSSRLNKQGTYTAATLDAVNAARWGQISWQGQNLGQSAKFYTRSGNTKEPNDTWSDWSTPYTDPRGENITSPAARFLQFKIDLSSSDQSHTPVIDAVKVVYRQQNIAPQLKAVMMNEAGEGGGINSPFGTSNTSFGSSSPESPGSSFFSLGPENGTKSKSSKNGSKSKQRGLQTVKWLAVDDNEDELIYDLYFKGVAESAWKLLEKELDKPAHTWNTEQMPDGEYQVKVVVSDKPDNPIGEALRDSLVSERFIVDNTPPGVEKWQVDVLSDGKIRMTFTADDELSPIDRVEYAHNVGEWEITTPMDFICDSYRESFDITIGPFETGEQYLVLRVTDEQENSRVFKKVVNVKK